MASPRMRAQFTPWNGRLGRPRILRHARFQERLLLRRQGAFIKPLVPIEFVHPRYDLPAFLARELGQPLKNLSLAHGGTLRAATPFGKPGVALLAIRP